MTKKSLRQRFKNLAGIKPLTNKLINEQVIDGLWIDEDGDVIQYNPNTPGGGGTNTSCVYGCMDPEANNYNSEATCWGDPYGVAVQETTGQGADYIGIAYGPAVCTYGYSCDTFDLWVQKLYELGMVNQQPPFNIDPNGWPSGVNGMMEFLCGEDPCAFNGGVCNSSLQYNPGQFCPACSTQYQFNSNGTGVSQGFTVCDCCCIWFDCPDDCESVPGCTDEDALNYNSYATEDDGSCIYAILGCTDPNANNYDPDATEDDGSCEYDPDPILGCTDSEAANYNPDATEDDGSCYYTGCTDPDALNYDETATEDDGSCEYPVEGCTDPDATNYDPFADIDDGSCEYPPPVEGCTDSFAYNYDSDATVDDGSCEYDGCMTQGAANYDPDATIDYMGPESPNFDEFGCMWVGCMDEEALNYDPEATYGPPNTTMTFIQNTNTGALITIPQCEYGQPACMDETACNYDPNASEPNYYNDTDLCTYPNECDSCEGDESCFGCTDSDAVNYEDDEEITFNDGSCYYELECYRCEYPPGPQMYGTPGELFTEIFYVNPETGDPDTGTGTAFGVLTGCPAEGDNAYGPNITTNFSPLEDWNEGYGYGSWGAVDQDYDWTEEELDCSGTHTTSEGKIECYQCEYPWPPVSPNDGGEVISQTFVYGIVGYDDPVCPEDWFENVEDLEANDQGVPCGPDPFFPESEKRYRCKIVSVNIDGTENGECIEDGQGPYISMQQCEDAGCGEHGIKKKRCYTCRGTNPVGWEFDDPPGCPKGWQSEPPTAIDCDPCIDPLVNQFLNIPQVIETHCCQSYVITGFPGPQCYDNWIEIGGDPSVDPHECCPQAGGMPPGPSTDGESDSDQDTTTYLQPKDKLRERFQKLAGVKKRK